MTPDENPAEQYTPDADEVRNIYVNHCDPAAIRDDDFSAEFDRFLARVRSDAAREALNSLVRRLIPGEAWTWHCKHCRSSETLDDQDDAYRAARLHTITVHGVQDYAPILEHQETA